MRYPLTLLLLLGIIASLAPTVIAAPSISGVSSPVVSGESITVSGFDFGTHALQVESLQSNIENGVVGQELSKSGWTRSDWGAWTDPLYANDSAHSGSKSLKCGPYSSYNCAFAYDMQDVGPGQRFYATWWVSYNGETDGQWKMLRVSGALTIIDGAQNANFYNWFSYQQQLVVNHGYTAQASYWGVPLPNSGDGVWYRMETDYVAGTTNGSNGTLTVRMTSDSGAITERIYTGVNTHPTSSDSWKYLIWQNYIGNGITNATIWIDDIYVQYNTPARVELCSGASWANRGKCEVQVPTSWKTDSISATVNTGNFQESSTAYLYVVDATGAANTTGYPVTIGGVPAQAGGGRLSGSLSGGGVMR